MKVIFTVTVVKFVKSVKFGKYKNPIKCVDVVMAPWSWKNGKHSCTTVWEEPSYLDLTYEEKKNALYGIHFQPSCSLSVN